MKMPCRIGSNRHGRLFLRLYWQNLDCREGTKLDDTPENRKLLEPKVAQINEEIARGTFDYLKHFPQGNKANHFRQEALRLEPRTIRTYFWAWVEGFAPPLAKTSRYEAYRSHFENHILPMQGDLRLTDYGINEIRALLSATVAKGTGVKTAKNILNGSLRAMFRDAWAEGLIERNPFDLLPAKWWPQTIRPKPDPFTAEERDKIIEYFRVKFPDWPAAHAFVLTMFWTGARPSEITARRWRDFDAITGTLSITTSRTRGEEGVTKTAGSRRTIPLFAPVIDAIKAIMPLRVQPDAHIFLDRKGNVLDQNKFGVYQFQAALRALGLRHRDFYHTRHSFITVMLEMGENPKTIAEYVGNSPQTIFQHYAGPSGFVDFGKKALAQTRDPDRDVNSK